MQCHEMASLPALRHRRPWPWSAGASLPALRNRRLWPWNAGAMVSVAVSLTTSMQGHGGAFPWPVESARSHGLPQGGWPRRLWPWEPAQKRIAQGGVLDQAPLALATAAPGKGKDLAQPDCGGFQNFSLSPPPPPQMNGRGMSVRAPPCPASFPPSLASEEVVRANAQASGRPSGRWPTKDPHFCILKADVTKDQQGTSG